MAIEEYNIMCKHLHFFTMMVLNLYLLLNRGELFLSKVSTGLTSWFSSKGIGKTLEIVGHKNISRQQHVSADITKPSEKNPRPAKKVA